MMIETKRLIIDRIVEKDKEDYFNNISHNKAVLETFICVYQEDLESFDFSKYVGRDDIFAIRLKEDGRLIGILTKFLVGGESIEIGYGIGSDYWNKGYTTEAVITFIDYLFTSEKFDTVYASFFTNNLASKRVMEKAGMKYSHTNFEELTYLGVKRDLIYYKISKNEYLCNNN